MIVFFVLIKVRTTSNSSSNWNEKHWKEYRGTHYPSTYLVLIMKTFWLPNLSFKTFCATVEVLFSWRTSDLSMWHFVKHTYMSLQFFNKNFTFIKKKLEKEKLFFVEFWFPPNFFLLLAMSDQLYRTALICIYALCSAVILTF